MTIIMSDKHDMYHVWIAPKEVNNVPKLTAGREQSQRERIESETAVLMRSRGLGRVSITEARRAVGLTHGAFYCHYSGTDDLEAAAYARVFGRSLETWRTKFRESGGQAQPAEWLIADYLSDASVTEAGSGCHTWLGHNRRRWHAGAAETGAEAASRCRPETHPSRCRSSADQD